MSGRSCSGSVCRLTSTRFGFVWEMTFEDVGPSFRRALKAVGPLRPPCPRSTSLFPQRVTSTLWGSFTVQELAQLDLLFCWRPGPARTMSASCPNSSLRKWRNCTFQHSMRSYRRFEFLGGRSPRWRRTVAHRAPRVRDDSGRSPRSRRTVGRRAPRVRDDSGRWKSRAQVVRELPQSPQGTTASTTPPFRRVVCVINALVPQGRLRHQRPRSAGSTA